MEEKIEIRYTIESEASGKYQVRTKLVSELPEQDERKPFFLERLFQAFRIIRTEVLPRDFNNSTNEIMNNNGIINIRFLENGFSYNYH